MWIGTLSRTKNYLGNYIENSLAYYYNVVNTTLLEKIIKIPDTQLIQMLRRFLLYILKKLIGPSNTSCI